MFGLVRTSTMRDAIARERDALAFVRDTLTRETARADAATRRARRLAARLRALMGPPTEPAPVAPPAPAPKPPAEPMPAVLAERVHGWDEAWAREDVADLFDEARQQAGSWQAVVGPMTDPGMPS